MDLELLHTICKEDTRNAFDEFKRVLAIPLFTFNENVREGLQSQLMQGLCSRTVKHFVTNNNLSNIQIKHLSTVIDNYKKIVLKTSNNHTERNVTQ